MMPIKIECGCGQRYAFDVEPVGGRMPWTVACPVCGIDGTEAANEAIIFSLPAPPPLPVAAPPAVRISTASAVTPAVRVSTPTAGPAVRVTASAPPAAASSTSRPAGRLPGQLDPDQAQKEARAKISWGDPPNSVAAFLVVQGFNREEASAMVRQMFKERLATVRAKGIRNTVAGSVMICIPVAFWFMFMNMRFPPVRTFGLTIMVGLYGSYLLINGICQFAAPKSERGDANA
jgi:hypothetical protein